MFLLAIALLTGFDLYVSYLRMRCFGPKAEFNLLGRYLAEKISLKVAIAGMGLYNVVLLLLVSYSPTLTHILFGAKVALAALQFKGYTVVRS